MTLILIGVIYGSIGIGIALEDHILEDGALWWELPIRMVICAIAWPSYLNWEYQQRRRRNEWH